MYSTLHCMVLRCVTLRSSLSGGMQPHGRRWNPAGCTQRGVWTHGKRGNESNWVILGTLKQVRHDNHGSAKKFRGTYGSRRRWIVWNTYRKAWAAVRHTQTERAFPSFIIPTFHPFGMREVKNIVFYSLRSNPPRNPIAVVRFRLWYLLGLTHLATRLTGIHRGRRKKKKTIFL